MPLISVIVPVYNEAKTIRQILEKINVLNIDKEIIVVDNCSSDGTRGILQDILKGPGYNSIRVIYHSYNKGKGESVREGIIEAKGDFVVIQDADLEYDPSEFSNLLKPLQNNQADLTLGARFTRGHSGLMAHRLGNKFLTALLNSMFGSQLNDYATCYKMAKRQVLIDFELKSKSFDIEVEIICKALLRKLRLKEVHVSYYPRSYNEGKKIRINDAFWAVLAMLKYRILEGKI